jgi:thiol-disulfide isomerase/thioredoxin
MLFAFFGYFFFTLFAIRFYEKKLPAASVFKIVFASMLLMQSYTFYLLFAESLFSLPFLLTYCLGIISAFLFLKLKRPFNLLPFALSLSLVLFIFFQGWIYWLHMINFGTFTGKVAAYALTTKFEARNEQNNWVSDDNFQNKIVLLDFWYTRCGVCFQKFPQVQAIYDKYKNDASVVILAVDKPIEEDKPNEAFEVIKDEGYTFPVVITKDKELPERFGVKYYPTTFVINPNGQIVYKGNIEGAVKMVDSLIRRSLL